MVILVTGANGQLGRSLRALAPGLPGYQFVFTGSADLDITDSKQTKAFLSQQKFTHVINCAAYTAVDKAEEEPEKALAVNRDGVANLADACANSNCRIVHISTDYVFNGTSGNPYSETDPPAPLSAYGKSKLEGEKVLQNSDVKSTIIRTSWLYSEFRQNFVKTMLRLMQEREEISVVDDQIGTPTWATDLAKTILLLIGNEQEMEQKELFHFSNSGAASWYDFAWEIADLAGLDCRIRPIPTSKYPLPAPRPHFSLMSKTKIMNKLAITIPHWKESLRNCLKNLNINQQ
ncbi:MAG: dTDP-4-dehydrorhamnose reductase [Bacteroidales bacterium]